MDLVVRECAVQFRIESEECTAKACEYARLINSNVPPPSLKKLKLHSFNLAIICLNIACDMLLYEFDQNKAIAMFGVSASAYRNRYSFLMKTLGFVPTEISHVRNLITILGYSHMKVECEKYLDLCRNSLKFKSVDIAALICGILYVLAKKQVPKISTKKFKAYSLLKTEMFKLLCSELECFIAKHINEEDNDKGQSQIESTVNQDLDIEEDYEEWKKRIIASLEES